LLTTILWDGAAVFDGKLYVGDQGGDGDADSTIYRVDASGAAQTFVTAPGPGLDDVYGMVFSPGGSYPAGLFVSGDTDGAGTGFGLFSATGTATTFAVFAGVEGLAFDTANRFGGGLWATMPAGGGYSGDDTLTRIEPNGTKAKALVSGVPGIHAIAFAPAGPFGGDAYVASWSSQKIMRIKPDGTISDLATGLSLTNYDGNILAFSPDGRVLFVADRSNHRIVCIEPTS
jgi:sugar lactone lactonase YvrE